MTFTELSVDELDDPVALLMRAFFTPGEASQAAGRAYIERLKLRTADCDAPISKKATGAQLEAIREWGAIPSTDRYAMLDRIRQPALVVHGNKDVVVTPINTFILAQHLPDTQLLMYPDAGCGAQSQHAGVFSGHLNGSAARGARPLSERRAARCQLPARRRYPESNTTQTRTVMQGTSTCPVSKSFFAGGINRGFWSRPG